MAFVSGSAWIERSFADGMRKCLAEEFSDLYVFHLRGDIRKNMLSKGLAKEGQNVFRFRQYDWNFHCYHGQEYFR